MVKSDDTPIVKRNRAEEQPGESHGWGPQG